MSVKKILMPVPAYGFDPTEAAIPWKILSEKGFDIGFATPDGTQACADIFMLRDDHDHLDRGFTVRDRNYLSARWPGDAYRFSNQFAGMLI